MTGHPSATTRPRAAEADSRADDSGVRCAWSASSAPISAGAFGYSQRRPGCSPVVNYVFLASTRAAGVIGTVVHSDGGVGVRG